MNRRRFLGLCVVAPAAFLLRPKPQQERITPAEVYKAHKRARPPVVAPDYFTATSEVMKGACWGKVTTTVEGGWI
jgi:hypothetical protein